MWIWDSNDLVNNVGNAREDLYSFCRSPHSNPDHKISVLFLYCRDALFNYQSNLHEFLADAYNNGFWVEYLDGDPSWATYNQQIGIERINKVIEFNNQATSETEKIKGIQFDVEPYLLKSTSLYNPPYYDTNMDSVWNLYVTYMDSCQKIVDTADTSLYFGIAIPRWYENHVGNSELYRLQSVVDYIAIMDYNEYATVIINDAANEINNATSLNKVVWIGVETKNVSPETVSFYEEGVSYMESQLEYVIEVYHNNDVFWGIAIHAYAYYPTLVSPSVIKYPNNPNYNINLFQNYENPVRNSTTIRYNLPTAMRVEINIYNVLGQNISTLVDEIKPQGTSSVNWDARTFQPGIYFYQIKTSAFTDTKKLLLIR